MPREEEGEAIKETEEGQVEAVVKASKDTEAGLEAVVEASKDTEAGLEAVVASKDTEEGLEQLLAGGWGAGKVVVLLVEWTTLNRS